MPRVSEFPEEGELVVCTVQSVKNFGAFVTLDEYGNKEGFVHVRDVATGWVKYIRDYIREGQKVVCKVLGVDQSKGHIDLSLKSVNEHQRREKIQQWKNETKAEKLLASLAKRLKAIGVDGPPFTEDLKKAQKDSHWVRPELVAEVAFSEWTGDGKIRHPSFQGLREDKGPGDVVRETAAPPPPAGAARVPGPRPKTAKAPERKARDPVTPARKPRAPAAPRARPRRGRRSRSR